MTEGLSAVLSRVDQIQQLIGDFQSAPVGSTSSSTTASATSSATSSADFAGALGDATGSSSDTGSTGTLGAQVVSIAQKYLGVPYKWGGTNPATGLDCSGLTGLVYKQVGISLPRTSLAQSQVGTQVASLSQAQPGDLLFFGSPVHHVGIYVGDNKMIAAPHTGSKVQVQTVYETPSVIRRVLPTTSTVSTASISADSIGAASLSSSSTSLAALLAGSSGGVTGALAGTPYAALFQAAGQRYGVDPALLSAVAQTESGYDASATSAAGAQGLMQLMPGTAASLGVDPTDPAQAIDGGARLLADNLRSFNGRVDLALAAYNAGPSAVRKYNGIPPYAETQSYVSKVQSAWGALR